MSKPDPFDPHPSDPEFINTHVLPELKTLSQNTKIDLSTLSARITGLQLCIWAHTQNRKERK